jgi:preprotein translocase subunit SecD
MPKNLRWKWILINIIVLGCVLGIVGLPDSKQALMRNWSKNIRLGLDLRGGSHMVLQVQVQDAFKAEADHVIEQLKRRLADKSVPYASIERNDPNSIETAETIAIEIRGVSGGDPDQLKRAVQEAAQERWALQTTENGGYRLTVRKEAAVVLRQETLAQTIETLERKVNALGVAEASAQQRGGADGEAEVLVQLPGVDDPARVKGILQTAAILELSELKGGPYESRAAAQAAHGGVLPPNTKIVRGSSRAGGGENYWLLARSPVVTGRDLRDARAQQSETGGWDTGFVLTQEAAGRFERFTEANINNRLAIVLDNVVLSAPRIDSKISDQGRIMGAANHEEAADLALNLRAGALPAGIKVIEERVVGPSLGADSIRRGLTAGLVGLALVIASMLVYYRGAGLNAVLALLLNTIITVAALSYIDATWTLPGIAGLVLSIGMAVDSNVLIFERIKEELHAGKGVPQAIAAGFQRALTTIVDTHVTTVVASAFLFLFGTGPVRGFAVTLVIGLVANLFTAVFVSRSIFDMQLWRHPRMARLSIWPRSADRELFEPTNIAFLKRPYLTLGLSAVLILASVASLVWNGGLKYGLDFRGGTLTYVRITPQPSIDELRAALSARLPGEVSVQETQGNGEFIIGTGLADEQTLEKARDLIKIALEQKYGQRDGKLDAAGSGSFEIRSVEMVGPRAGSQMRKQAMQATAGALAGMLVYIAFRFRLTSGVAAVIATIHDVVITLGLLALTGRELNLNVIAALLTLIGYSMNDKIVVFDRVRENQQTGRRDGSFIDLVNHSINQTLSRTLLTAGPTLLACLALYYLGGEVLNGIAFALLVGIVAGTYSSIFVASAVLVLWHGHREKARTPKSQTAMRVNGLETPGQRA